jgi:hypothetical protein
MKQTIISIFFACMATYSVAVVKTVSNVPGDVAQFSTLTAAIIGTAPDDTLLISPSGVSYGSITVDKRLHLIGGGGQDNVTLNSLTFSSSSASGSTVEGLNIIGSLSSQQVVTGLLIRYNRMETLSLYRISASIAYNNIISDRIQYLGEQGGQIVSNNIIYTANATFPALHNPGTQASVFRNNVVFLGPTASMLEATTGNFQSIDFHNNIIVGALNTDECMNCTFNNNLLSSCTNCTFDTGSNNGVDNIINTVQGFVNYISPFSPYEDDLHLMPTSPGYQTGTMGTDMGVFGGQEPFPANSIYGILIPGLPYVSSFQTVNLVVPVDSNLPFNASGFIIGE